MDAKLLIVGVAAVLALGACASEPTVAPAGAIAATREPACNLVPSRFGAAGGLTCAPSTVSVGD